MRTCVPLPHMAEQDVQLDQAPTLHGVGHAPVLQEALSEAGGHELVDPASLFSDRVRVILPPPHVLVHLPKEPQFPGVHSTKTPIFSRFFEVRST